MASVQCAPDSESTPTPMAPTARASRRACFMPLRAAPALLAGRSAGRPAGRVLTVDGLSARNYLQTRHVIPCIPESRVESWSGVASTGPARHSPFDQPPTVNRPSFRRCFGRLSTLFPGFSGPVGAKRLSLHSNSRPGPAGPPGGAPGPPGGRFYSGLNHTPRGLDSQGARLSFSRPRRRRMPSLGRWRYEAAASSELLGSAAIMRAGRRRISK
jgi:hypothetical protein